MPGSAGVETRNSVPLKNRGESVLDGRRCSVLVTKETIGRKAAPIPGSRGAGSPSVCGAGE